MEKRRTHRSFLSDEEAARDTRRTVVAVRSIVGKRQIQDNVPKVKPALHGFIDAPTVRVGETDAFIVEYRGQDRKVAIYGKEIPSQAALKLKLKISETKDLICLLQKTTALTEKQENVRLGKGQSFVVDYDGSQKLVMVYDKGSECQFKLAFDEGEVAAVVKLLLKARTLF